MGWHWGVVTTVFHRSNSSVPFYTVRFVDGDMQIYTKNNFGSTLVDKFEMDLRDHISRLEDLRKQMKGHRKQMKSTKPKGNSASLSVSKQFTRGAKVYARYKDRGWYWGTIERVHGNIKSRKFDILFDDETRRSGGGYLYFEELSSLIAFASSSAQ